MKNKYVISDLEKIRLLIEYDVSKTYFENNQFISEQSDLRAATSSAGATATYYDGPYFSPGDWDSHEFLNCIEITSGVLGMLPTPLAPLFLGISVIAGVADAKLYFDENDPYMGTMMLALTLIPGGDLLKIFKTSKAFQKIGVSGLKKLIKAYKSGNLKKESVKYLKEFTNIFKLPSVTKQVSKGIIEASLLTLKSNLKNKSSKFLINFLIYLYKISKWAGKTTFKVGGIVFTIDKLYLLIFADNEKYFNSRQKNELRMLINKTLGITSAVKDYENNPDVKKQLLDNIDKQLANPEMIEEVLGDLKNTTVKDYENFNPSSFDSIPNATEIDNKPNATDIDNKTNATNLRSVTSYSK